MRQHQFTKEDLYAGRELLCMRCKSSPYMTVGKVYVILQSPHLYPNATHPHRISDDYGVRDWALYELNATQPIIALYPLDLLTKKERFIFELSGRFP